MKKTIITIALYFSAIFLALRLIIPAAINNADFILIEPSNQKYISYLFDKDLVDFSWETVSIVGSRGFINTISEFRLVNPKDNLLSYTEIRNYASVEQLETEMEHLTEETNFGVIKDHNSLIVFSANSPELAETLNVFDVEDYPVNEAAVLKALSNNAYTHYYRSSVTSAQRHPITHTLPYLFNSLVFPIILCVLPLVYKSLSLYFS